MLTRFLTIGQVTKLLGMGHGTINEMVKTGSFPVPFPFGKKRKWRQDDVEQWMTSLADVRGTKTADPARKTWTHTPAVLANLSSLAGLAMEFPACESAVYFLVRCGQIMYVGQSSNLPSRIGQHRNTARTDPDHFFDRVFYIPLPNNMLAVIEQQYIDLFAPPWNIAGNPLCSEPEVA
jgi:excisionase family DNA binding protein